MCEVTNDIHHAAVRALFASTELVEVLHYTPPRNAIQHVGRPIPPVLRDLTEEEKILHHGSDFVKFEEFGPEKHPVKGIFWTQKRFDKIHKGCGEVTILSDAIASALRDDPAHFGTLYCKHCGDHLRTGKDGHFIWANSHDRVGV